jgi:hypothetical protein
MHIIDFKIGDWSHDGHNMTETLILKSDYDASYINIVIEKANEALGFNIRNLCSDYKESSISAEIMKQIFEYCGNYLYNWEIDSESEDDVDLEVESFADMIVAILNATDPHLCLSILQTESLRGFGYGLFYC